MNEFAGDVTRWQRHENEVVEALHLDGANDGLALRWIVQGGGDAFADGRGVCLVTDEGVKRCLEGHWVVRDEQGRFTIVPNTIFHIAYDPA